MSKNKYYGGIAKVLCILIKMCKCECFACLVWMMKYSQQLTHVITTHTTVCSHFDVSRCYHMTVNSRRRFAALLSFRRVLTSRMSAYNSDRDLNVFSRVLMVSFVPLVIVSLYLFCTPLWYLLRLLNKKYQQPLLIPLAPVPGRFV